MMTRRNWRLFEAWQDEQVAEWLARLTPERSLEIAEGLFRHALTLSPETVRWRPDQSADEILASDDMQTILRMRQVFEAHADRHQQ
jgi:hypothetical protein